MSDVSFSIGFLDRAQINFSLVFPRFGYYDSRQVLTWKATRAQLDRYLRLRTTTYSLTLVSAYVYLYVRTETCTYLLFTGRG